MNMTAIATQPPTGGNPGLHVVPATGTELAPARGTPRGKTNLSLAELQDRTSHYPQELRVATAAAQTFFVEHCSSNIDMFVGVAKNEIKFPRSPEYFGNWMKGSYFRGGMREANTAAVAAESFRETTLHHSAEFTARG